MTWLVVTTGLAAASPWVEPTGVVRLGLQVSQLASSRQFAGGEVRGFTGPRCPEPVGPGDRMPYSCVTGGTYRQRTGTLFTQLGLGGSVALDLQVPGVVASFEDDVGRTAAGGIGDLRGGLRVGRQAGRWAWAAALHVKAPTGPGDFQDRDVPLGTGQWDLEPGLRLGYSLHPWGWAELFQTVRVRLPQPETGIDPGDEWLPTLAVGLSPWPEIGLLTRVEGLLALHDRDAFGVRTPGRRLLQVRPTIFLRPVEAAWIEVGVAVPLAGRRWPAAAIPQATLMWTFGR